MFDNVDQQLQDRARRMLDHCELSSVRVVDFSARRFDGHGQPVTVHLASETSYLVNAEAFFNRYAWQARLDDAQGVAAAEFTATVLLEYELHEGFEPDPEAAEVISGTTGYFAAYPYVREIFQSHATRLMLDPVVLGMLLAYAINQLLMGKYELPRLPLYYLPVGAVLLWLLGQIAVYGPARKAASVPPAVATRSA
jgi:hypothetical protein